MWPRMVSNTLAIPEHTEAHTHTEQWAAVIFETHYDGWMTFSLTLQNILLSLHPLCFYWIMSLGSQLLTSWQPPSFLDILGFPLTTHFSRKILFFHSAISMQRFSCSLTEKMTILSNSTNQIQYAKEDWNPTFEQRHQLCSFTKSNYWLSCPVGSFVLLVVYRECLFQPITVMVLLTLFILLGRQFL